MEKQLKTSKKLLFTLLFILVTSIISLGQNESTQKILNSFVEDYKNDPMALTVSFGIKIDEEWWHVTVQRNQEAYTYTKKYTFHRFGPNQVTLHKGKPKQATWYFKIADKYVLNKINTGKWNAGTASMKTTPKDVYSISLITEPVASTTRKGLRRPAPP